MRALRGGDGQSAWVAHLRLPWSDGTLLDVRYPAASEYDTHLHEHVYVGLVLRGSYQEWAPRARRLGVGALACYDAGSSHAVRVGPDDLHILHLVGPDPACFRWGAGLEGTLWQLAYELFEPSHAAAAPASELVVESLVAEALVPRPGEGELRPASSDWLVRVLECIRDDPGTPGGLVGLARLVGVHPAHLARSFRQRRGMTVGEYARRLRIARSVDALRDVGRPLSSVALEAGFADQSHYGRFFRRYTGTTPARLRASFRSA